MSVSYRGIGWDRQKRLYDAALASGITLAFGSFAALTAITHPLATAETLLIRGSAATALLLLHVILCIGPLTRLDKRFLPLLYNRRHLGVAMFFLALFHAALSTFQFHALGDINPIVSVFTAYGRDYAPGAGRIMNFPFEPFGAVALVILFLMAATSHDFWLKNLGASFWKTMHLFVYATYGLILVHVFFGALQSERSSVYPVILAMGFAVTAALHLAAYRREKQADHAGTAELADGYVDACAVDDVREGRGRTVLVAGERVAIYLHEGRLYAVSNVCRHQGGPIGEGRIVDGCITCPWHGWNYRPEDGCSPPPFKEVLPTYNARVAGGRVYIHPKSNPPATRCEGAACASPPVSADEDPFYIGYLPRVPASHARKVCGFLLALTALIPLVMILAAVSQNPIDVGTFEFGTLRTFEGVMHESPFPVLRIEAPGGDSEFVNLILVGAGKHGIPEFARGHDGQRVRLEGTLIHRKGLTAIEVGAEEKFEVVGGGDTPARDHVESLGTVRLRGEIVDTKCFVGVMRPSAGKVHRACAIRCLSGGIPPGLLVHDLNGGEAVFLLAPREGSSLKLDVQEAGIPVEVSGEAELHGDTPVLRVASVRRL